jgi:hypothetical protein
MGWRNERPDLKPFFWPAYVLRICGGLFIGVLYNGYYTGGDTWAYFNDGSTIAAVAGESWSGYFQFLWSGVHPSLEELAQIPPRALFFTKITSLVVLLSGYNYWISACWFSLISFLSSWLLVKEIESVQPRWRGPALFSFLFFPSVVCWSSGLIKESLAMGALYYIVVVFLRIWASKRISPAFGSLLLPAFWVLWGLKYYYLAVLLPVMTTELFMNRIVRPRVQHRKPIVDAAIWLLIFLIPVSAVSVLHPNFYPQRFLDVIVTNYETFQSISDPDDVVQYSGLAAETQSVLSHAPKALVVGLFRPFLWEVTDAMKFIAATENFVLLLLFGGFITASIRRARSVSPLSGPLMIYCFVLAIFLALSTPNFGTLFRYRVGFLPFFVLLITAGNPLISWLASVVDRSNKPLVG